MKNIKAILWDVDGVIITNAYAFSKHMQEYYLDEKDDMLDFFVKDLPGASTGKSDLKEILEPRLTSWNWSIGIDNFLDFWFLSECQTDSRVLGMMKSLKEKGIITCLATNQSPYRKKFLLEKIGLGEYLDAGYFSCDLGICKPDPKYYEKILVDLGLEAHEVLVIDDDKKNIAGAMSIGMQGIFYQDFKDIKELKF